MDDRGQISAEYLLLIVVILVILSFVTIPLMGESIDASNNVSQASDAKVVVESIANAVNIVYANGPGAKKSLDVNIPKNGMDIQYNSSSLILKNNIAKPVNATVNANVSLNTNTLNKGWYKAIVYWDFGKTFVNVNLTKT